MHRQLSRTLLLSIATTAFANGQELSSPVFVENFQEVDAHIPPVQADLTCDFIGLERIGPGRSNLKLSYHPNVPNDPHYIWNGLCTGPILLAFPFAHPLDLSDKQSTVQVRSKNVGGAALHLALKSDGYWYVQENAVPQNQDWTEDSLHLHGGDWFALVEDRVLILGPARSPDWGNITAIGFVAPEKGGISESCIRLDWFSLHSSSAVRDPEAKYPTETDIFAPFFEGSVPFVRSALVADIEDRPNRTRRGVLVNCGKGVWACFDPDLLRWSLVWRLPKGQTTPISMDAMSSTSYPDHPSKAGQAPRPVGEILESQPEELGINLGEIPVSDPRTARLLDGLSPVGPLPTSIGRFSGVELTKEGPGVIYSISGIPIRERIRYEHPIHYVRTIKIGARDKPISMRLSDAEFRKSDSSNVEIPSHTFSELHVTGEGAEIRSTPELGTWLNIAPGPTRVIEILHMMPAWDPIDVRDQRYEREPQTVASTKSASPLLGKPQGPFHLRNIALPQRNDSARALRPTDIAFTKNGDAWVTTFDGDVWRVRNVEQETATWKRVATGLFEPTGIEIDTNDRIFVLGRDQITRLIDTDGDGMIDRFENTADGFWQTLHTRDYSMSMALEPGGSFLVAKGGIRASAQKHSEHSAHRGAILRIFPDGPAQVLADGLRLPYVGRRNDGTIFASDQQGHWVPSSPLLRIGANHPSFGFVPTRHRDKPKDLPKGEEEVRETANQPDPIEAPLFWFPYQANRSGAGFATLDGRAFPDLPGEFLHVAWDGRLFSVVTPEAGSPFGWRLPLQFDFPTLNGATHPKSGEFYVIGLGLKGYLPMTPKSTGLAAVRQASQMLAPGSFDIQPDRVSIAFRKPVPDGMEIEFVSLRLWNLKRSASYGSGHYRWDGTPGEHSILPKKITWSHGRSRLHLETQQLFQSDIAVLHLQVRRSDGEDYPLELYSRPAHLTRATTADIAAGLAGDFPSESQAHPRPSEQGNATLGKQLFTRHSCVGCHSIAGAHLVGPPLNGLTKEHPKAFEQHLRDSILKPNKVVTQGYPAAMPSYEGVITPSEVEHLVAYLKSL